MSLILHMSELSTPCWAVNMVIDILGLNVTKKELDLMGAREQHSPEFLAKNPQHSVPLLEDRGFYVADSHAINTYLVSKYGAEHRATLYPVDIQVRSLIDQRLFLDATTVFPAYRAMTVDIMVNKAKEVSPFLKLKFEEAYGLLEKYLEGSLFLAADHVTLADISCVASVAADSIFVPVDEKYTKVHEWWNRMKQYEWYQVVANGHQKLDGLMKGLMARSN